MSDIKIGLCGKLRAGKDTVADYLVANYGFTKFAFGDALKDDFHRENPHVPREPKPRGGYQTHGQRKRRTIGEDVWVDACFNRISKYRKEIPYPALYYNRSDNVFERVKFRPIITDIRQPNEHARCRAEGYTIIRVAASDDVRLARAKAAGDHFDAATLDHETERHVDGFDVDFVVENNGRWMDMAEQVDVIMRALDAERMID